MEKLVAGFAVLGALLVLAANVSVSEAQTVKSYFKAGGELRLSPVPVSEQITSIVWKYEKNLLAEWMKDSIPLTYYRTFNGRSTLDTTTGVLVVQRMTAADIGLYSVEINNKVQGPVYQPVAIGEVPEPMVDLQPLVCNRPEKCGLKCHGNVTNAEPVEYFWRNDDGDWEMSLDKKELSSKEMDDVKFFFCRMKNPVSEKDSKAFKNPFYQEAKPTESAPVGAIVGGVVLLCILCILIALGIWKRDVVRQKIPFLRRSTDLGSTHKDNKVENKELLNQNVETGKPQPATSDDSREMSEVAPSKPTEMPPTSDESREMS